MSGVSEGGVNVSVHVVVVAIGDGVVTVALLQRGKPVGDTVWGCAGVGSTIVICCILLVGLLGRRRGIHFDSFVNLFDDINDGDNKDNTEDAEENRDGEDKVALDATVLLRASSLGCRWRLWCRWKKQNKYQV
jgi:hypothetical protein